MKQETNNEMDLLLRRLGRRRDISVTDGNGDVEHLDADELSAYAENVLPAAARARYTEHLAECARCRELVAQLSSSAGVLPAVETVKAPVPSALRKFLASLFSPLVLRYAVPALGLILVAAIGLFVLRQRRLSEGESIAQSTEAPAARAFVTPNASEPATPSSGFYNEPSKEQSAGKPTPSSSGSPGNETGAAAPVPPAPAVSDQSSSTSLAKKEDQQPTPADVPAAAAPKPTADSREQQAKAEREETSQARAASEPPAEKSKTADSVKVEDRKEDRKAAEVEPVRSVPVPGSAGTFSSGVGGIAQTKRQRDDAAGADKDNKNAETKTVAGRRFRKQDGVWVDTAYSSSRNAVNVARGSEQYRALIADEPGIKTIAEQLDGEILVVWKGHTYHIR